MGQLALVRIDARLIHGQVQRKFISSMIPLQEMNFLLRFSTWQRR